MLNRKKKAYENYGKQKIADTPLTTPTELPLSWPPTNPGNDMELTPSQPFTFQPPPTDTLEIPISFEEPPQGATHFGLDNVDSKSSRPPAPLNTAQRLRASIYPTNPNLSNGVNFLKNVKKLDTPDDLYELCNEYKHGIPKEAWRSVLEDQLKCDPNSNPTLYSVVSELNILLTGVNNNTPGNVTKSLTKLCDPSRLEPCLTGYETKYQLDAKKLGDSISDMVRNTYAPYFAANASPNPPAMPTAFPTTPHQTATPKDTNAARLQETTAFEARIRSMQGSMILNQQRHELLDKEIQACEKQLFDLFSPYKATDMTQDNLAETFEKFKGIIKEKQFDNTLASKTYVKLLNNYLLALLNGIAFDVDKVFCKCYWDCKYADVTKDEPTLKELLPSVIKKTYKLPFAQQLRNDYYETYLFKLFSPYNNNGINSVEHLQTVLNGLTSYPLPKLDDLNRSAPTNFITVTHAFPAIKPIHDYLEQLTKGHKPATKPIFDGASYKSGDLTLNALVNAMIKNTVCDDLIKAVPKKESDVRAAPEKTLQNRLPDGYAANTILSSEDDAKKLLTFLDELSASKTGEVVADLKSKLGLLISGAWINENTDLTNPEYAPTYCNWYDCIMRTIISSGWALDKQRKWFDDVLTGKCKDSAIDPFEVLSRKAIMCVDSRDKLWELIGYLDKLKGSSSSGEELKAVVDKLKTLFNDLLKGKLTLPQEEEDGKKKTVQEQKDAAEKRREAEEKLAKLKESRVEKITEMSVSGSKHVRDYLPWVNMLNNVILQNWVNNLPEDSDWD